MIISTMLQRCLFLSVLYTSKAICKTKLVQNTIFLFKISEPLEDMDNKNMMPKKIQLKY